MVKTKSNELVPRRRREPAASPLRTARLAKGWNQYELAEAAGISAGWVSMVERAPGQLTQPVAERLARALGTTADELLKGSR